MAKKNQTSNLKALIAAMSSPQALPHLATTTAASAPAATAPLPAWVDAAKAAAPAVVARPAAPKVPASLTRTWSVVDTGMSKAQNPYIVFGTQTSNGRPFNVTVPADLVAFIAAQAN